MGLISSGGMPMEKERGCRKMNFRNICCAFSAIQHILRIKFISWQLFLCLAVISVSSGGTYVQRLLIPQTGFEVLWQKRQTSQQCLHWFEQRRQSVPFLL